MRERRQPGGGGASWREAAKSWPSALCWPSRRAHRWRSRPVLKASQDFSANCLPPPRVPRSWTVQRQRFATADAGVPPPLHHERDQQHRRRRLRRQPLGEQRGEEQVRRGGGRRPHLGRRGRHGFLPGPLGLGREGRRPDFGRRGRHGFLPGPLGLGREGRQPVLGLGPGHGRAGRRDHGAALARGRVGRQPPFWLAHGWDVRGLALLDVPDQRPFLHRVFRERQPRPERQRELSPDVREPARRARHGTRGGTPSPRGTARCTRAPPRVACGPGLSRQLRRGPARRRGQGQGRAGLEGGGAYVQAQRRRQRQAPRERDGDRRRRGRRQERGA
ncbi:hypothetical protein T484DRAFT_1892177, partial [Baffinella frigidus]